MAALDAMAEIGAREAAPAVMRLLSDRSRWVRENALDAVGALAGDEAVPAVIRLLEDPERPLRREAGEWLCARGRREGVSQLLERDNSLHALNALRSPELWKKLGARRVETAAAGTRREMVDRLIREAGMVPEWAGARPGEDPAWMAERVRRPPGAGFLRQLSRFLYYHYCFVLEGDRVRILHGDDAREFWEVWWEAERKK